MEVSAAEVVYQATIDGIPVRNGRIEETYVIGFRGSPREIVADRFEPGLMVDDPENEGGPKIEVYEAFRKVLRDSFRRQRIKELEKIAKLKENSPEFEACLPLVKLFPKIEVEGHGNLAYVSEFYGSAKQIRGLKILEPRLVQFAPMTDATIEPDQEGPLLAPPPNVDATTDEPVGQTPSSGNDDLAGDDAAATPKTGKLKVNPGFGSTIVPAGKNDMAADRAVPKAKATKSKVAKGNLPTDSVASRVRARRQKK